MSAPLLQRFISSMKNDCSVSSKETLLVAVSGGIDSVVLAALCREAGYHFHLAHVNFQLRGSESARDENFVRALAASWDVPFHTIMVDTRGYAAIHKCSIQEAARQLRYQWFEKLIGDLHSIHRDQAPQVICTAHHLDDNIETMVMNFFRGTGIHGLRGMLPRQGRIARPLLSLTKEALKEYARQQRLGWVEDSSNQENKYSRNAIRNELLPLAASIYPEVAGNLARNVQRFYDIEILYEQAIAAHRKKLLNIAGNELHLPVALLEKTVPLNTILFEIIHPFGFNPSHIEELKKLMKTASGHFIASATHRIFRNRKWMIIAPLQTTIASNIFLEEGVQQVDFPEGRIRLSEVPGRVVSKENNVATVDRSLIQYPFLLRKWKAGDYFYPFGMKKKKKLSRFFIDRKLSVTDKEKVWVIEANKKIIWVIGHRIDERFRVTDNTPSTLKFQFVPQRDLK